ncbi:uncharacterized protein LOC117807775 [Xyrichtys novacula]|uniref:Uncharacterized protein LOC117807775 n=1 Tax=Xyrichtys novacula TaxID=13765 RepID=A0AAV1HL52_XYRNO|nr:uncharacterized protein LOC117807775 [Xyrichtys novacula]
MNGSEALNLNVETSLLFGFPHHSGAAARSLERAFMTNNAALSFLLIGAIYEFFDVLALIITVYRRTIYIENLTVYVVSLTCTSILQGLFSPIIVVALLSTTCYLKYCQQLINVWLATRRFGVLLHLLAALEFLLIQKRSYLGSKLLSIYCTVPVILTLKLICTVFVEVLGAAVFLGVIALALTCGISILVILSPEIRNKRTLLVVLFASVTFVVTYGPSFVVECMALNLQSVPIHLYPTFLCLTNMRLMMDGFLSWVICKEPRQAAPQQLVVGQVNLDPASQVPD